MVDRLHMRPIQWHLKRHWHVPESLKKVVPLPQSLHPHLDWWLLESNVLWGQPLHPLQHALQIFTDASNVGWGAHLGDSRARGVWSEPESRLHINFLELKAVFLALKSFEPLCKDQIVLIATDKTTVVSYINKEGGMRSGCLCALLWRLLSWCHPRRIVLRARHIPGHLNVIADKLSRRNQVIQTEWSLSQQVFNLLCSRWVQPRVDLFATRFNHKLPWFVSPVHRDLVTQPFNGLVHRNLSNLNLHAWLLEPRSSRSKASLMRWQQEVKLLRGLQPEQCTNQSGPFLSNGVTHIRWTSGRPL